VFADSGEVAIEVPRDRDGSFEPVIVAKRQRRLSSIDEIVLSLHARGLTTGDIAAHFGQIYDAQVSKDTISPITDRVLVLASSAANAASPARRAPQLHCRRSKDRQGDAPSTAVRTGHDFEKSVIWSS